MIICIPFETLFLLWYVGKEMSIHSTYFQRRLHQPDCSGRWQKPVYVKSRSTTWGPQPARLRSVTHTASPRSPTACQWHGKVCLTRLPVTHFLSQPCTCTPLGDVMAGFPFGVALLSTLPIWHNVRMHACVCLCVYIHQHAWLRHQSAGAAVNVALHSFSDDLLSEEKAFQKRKAHQTDRGERGQW